MVTSLISVQSKKKKRQTPKIYSTRKLKVLFRNSNHSENFFPCRKFFSGRFLEKFSRKIFHNLFFQISVAKMNITVMVTMVVFQLVGCAMANQIACWVMMKKDVQQSYNHLQIGSKFILIRQPIRIKRILKQQLSPRKLLLIVSWLVFHGKI